MKFQVVIQTGLALILLLDNQEATPLLGRNNPIDKNFGIENKTTSGEDNNCQGKPFGDPCNLQEGADHTFGFCDNDICIGLPLDLGQLDLLKPQDIKCEPDNEFACNDGTCIDLEWKCDGEGDCYDDSDEAEELCINS